VTGRKVIVHTDIILDHLLQRGSTPSLLRRVLGVWFCYTTVFNAIELFSYTSGERERLAVRNALSPMKLLGMNAKGAPAYGELLRTRAGDGVLNILVAGLARESRLPVLTARPSDFPRIRGVRILLPGDVPDGETSRRH
jgi:predicted nucleic acid-binding protein